MRKFIVEYKDQEGINRRISVDAENRFNAKLIAPAKLAEMGLAHKGEVGPAYLDPDSVSDDDPLVLRSAQQSRHE